MNSGARASGPAARVNITFGQVNPLGDQPPTVAMKTKTLAGLEADSPRCARAAASPRPSSARPGVSQRAIAYYETESQQPLGALLADLATALKVSADELLGLKPIAEKRSPKRARLLKRLQKVEDLATANQPVASRSSTASSPPGNGARPASPAEARVLFRAVAQRPRSTGAQLPWLRRLDHRPSSAKQECNRVRSAKLLPASLR